MSDFVDSSKDFVVKPGAVQPGSLLTVLAMQNNPKHILATPHPFSIHIIDYPLQHQVHNQKDPHSHMFSSVQYRGTEKIDGKKRIQRSQPNIIFHDVNMRQKAAIEEYLEGDHAKACIYNEPKKSEKIRDTLTFVSKWSSTPKKDEKISWTIPKLLTTRQLFFPVEMKQATDFVAQEGLIYDKIGYRVGFNLFKSDTVDEDNIESLDIMARKRSRIRVYPTQFIALHTPACGNYKDLLHYDSGGFQQLSRENKTTKDLMTNMGDFTAMQDSWDVICIEPNMSSLLYRTTSLAQIKKDLAQFEKTFIDPYYQTNRRLDWAENEMQKVSGYDPTHYSHLPDTRAKFFDNYNEMREEHVEWRQDPLYKKGPDGSFRNGQRPLALN